MTILDANGKLAGEAADDQWMHAALIHWLSEERTRLVLLRQRVFSPGGLMELIAGLSRAALAGRPVRPSQLREVMLKVLSNRVVRIRIAADILRREYENRAGFDIMVRDFDSVLASWSRYKLLGQDVGPRPEKPTAEEQPPPPRHRGAVMAELRAVQLELEQRSESGIESPFA